MSLPFTDYCQPILSDRTHSKLALGAFKTRNLSLGKPAELAQMDKRDFIGYLYEEKVSVFNIYPEDFKNQLKLAHDIAKDLKV